MKHRFLVIAVLSALILGACANDAAPPVAATKAPQCAAGNGGTLVCIDGNGNTVVLNPGGTPSPTPATSACSKLEPRYQDIVVQAEAGITPAQTMESYINALMVRIRAAGFLVTTGGLLPTDEIAIKTSATAPFSETYDVWRSDNTPHVLYQETCSPARF